MVLSIYWIIPIGGQAVEDAVHYVASCLRTTVRKKV